MTRIFLISFTLLALAACSSSKNSGDGDGGHDGGDGGGDCVPATCTGLATDQRVACGTNPDGCGGTVTCTDPEGASPCRGFMVCGEDDDGINRCRHPGTGACTPLDASEACGGAECGYASDGCDGVVLCGACAGGESCSAGSCGGGACTPTPVGEACEGRCGQVSDGCEGSYTCNDGNGGVTCEGYEYCGWGGEPNECGAPPCTPTTCEELGFSCGLAPDGCGRTLNCWPNPASPACPNPNERCIGGIGEPARCVAGDDGGGCVGPLCDFIPDCDGMPTTRLSGRVTSPDGELGVPNAVVYIPRDPAATLPPITTGPSCERCEDENLGPFLASAVTDHRGEFTLEGQVPAGAPFRIVVKAGKWRRVTEVPSGVVEACDGANLGGAYSRLPAHEGDGLSGTHLPRIAVATGGADAMECVLYKMGFSLDEFTAPSGAGRVHMYRANGARLCDGSIGSSSCLGGNDCDGSCNSSPEACYACGTGCSWGTTSCSGDDISGDSDDLDEDFSDYDMVIWDCEGTDRDRSTGAKNRLRDYVNAGGRFFASHWSYDWLFETDELEDAAMWRDVAANDTDQGYISLGRPRANPARIETFARWLHHEGAIAVTFVDGEPTFGAFQIQFPRDVVDSINPGADEWIFRRSGGSEGSPPGPFLPEDGARPQQFSFNTPWGADAGDECGRVAFTGFHVAGSYEPGVGYFPGHCAGTELNTQEKTLAFMLFDLAACISDGEPPNPPPCTPLEPEDACGGGVCGGQPDGCGGVVQCSCPGDEECVGGFCGGTCPVPTCGEIGAECGAVPDGCGGILDCGTCPAGTFCGAGGANQCGGVIG